MNYGVTKDGFVPKPLTAIIDDLNARAKVAFGSTVDLTSTSPLAKFIHSIAYEHALLWQLLEDVYYSGYLEYAEGSSLDNVVALLGIVRNQAAPARGEVTITLAPGYTDPVVIETGTLVGTADNSAVYRVTSPAQLWVETDTLTVTVPIEAVEPGTHGNVGAGFITKMVTPKSGIGGVTNAEPCTGGTEVENDVSLRLRAAAYSFVAKGTIAAMRGALLAIDGVSDVRIVEDTTLCKATITVLGGADEAITATIEDTRPCGILVEWNRPTLTPITFTVSVTGVTGYETFEVVEAVKSAIQSYIDKLTIGEVIYFSGVADAILDCPYVTRLENLSITDGTNVADAFGESIVIPINTKASVDTITVTVV